MKRLMLALGLAGILVLGAACTSDDGGGDGTATTVSPETTAGG
jgi:hypothetical protein